MIFRFATMQDKSIKGSLEEKHVASYCRKVTWMWCGFFIFNGGIAAITIFFGSDIIWSVYNGGISYILMGSLFAGEFLVRKMVQKRMPKAAALSKFKHNSRPLSTVLCYEGAWSGGCYKTWEDFLRETAQLRVRIESIKSEKWLLNCDDCWYFLTAFTSLLQCKKEVILSANVSPAYLDEIRCGAPFLTDQDIKGENIFNIQALLKSESGTAPQFVSAINADETSITMYTSGSTGKPKAVRQRLTEFEADNRYVLSQWGGEFLKRKLCSTVNQHHIYGLLFSILLPFTAAVPFRRKRIEFPEEFEVLNDTEYMIITVPAFLKRAVEIEADQSKEIISKLNLKSPWIFTSGGLLARETAKKTSEVFGFWPVEIYGSTETSGIAYRQSFNGQEWTPFDNASLSKNPDGCLIIKSPYIKDPSGYETADMVEILEDGRFLLNGRIDSVVKIEEKRISLTEIESRILQSGFSAEACVIAMNDKRQYLAAAIVFNDKGRERFSNLEKNGINKFFREYLLQYFENIFIPKKWRYVESLPVDSQGKKKKDDIILLFSDTNDLAAEPRVLNHVVKQETDTSLTVEFTIPDTSPYFDGHFPGFLILPAVAQTEIVLRFASQYLGTGIIVSEINRLKFTSLIRPFTTLLLQLEKKDKTISFKISSPDRGTIYSLGALITRGDM
jgi:acyl-coenzyme A synthetase/AMP-(fatty) acid ligase/3-hydroxymyristoyl/3-hydroxydecanoyl-(acyl carrier protein) dehydratase